MFMYASDDKYNTPPKSLYTGTYMSCTHALSITIPLPFLVNISFFDLPIIPLIC